MNFQGIIFDMDGLLIDSEQYWVKQDAAFFERRNIPYNTEMLEEVKLLLAGNSVTNGSALLKEKFNLSESVEEIVAERTKHTEEIYTRLSVPFPGVVELLDTLLAKEVPMAIGSGSSLNRIEEIVNRFNWQKYFDTLVSSDHVGYRGKPEPDIFLYAADKLSLDPEGCVVFEDSVNGIWAAKHAKMAAIAIPDEHDAVDQFSHADLITSSIKDKAVYDYLGVGKE